MKKFSVVEKSEIVQFRHIICCSSRGTNFDPDRARILGEPRRNLAMYNRKTISARLTQPELNPGCKLCTISAPQCNV